MVYNFIRTTSPFQYNANMATQFRAMESMRDDFKLKYEKAKKDYETNKTVANKLILDRAEEQYTLYAELNSTKNIKSLLPPKGDLSYGTTNKKDILLLWSRYAPKAPKPAAKDSLNVGNSANFPFQQPTLVYSFTYYVKT